MAKKDWIKGAIKHPGSFTEFAKSRGETVSEAAHDKNLTPHRAAQARLALTLKKMHHKGK